jgi:hypothetical protein
LAGGLGNGMEGSGSLKSKKAAQSAVRLSGSASFAAQEHESIMPNEKWTSPAAPTRVQAGVT